MSKWIQYSAYVGIVAVGLCVSIAITAFVGRFFHTPPDPWQQYWTAVQINNYEHACLDLLLESDPDVKNPQLRAERMQRATDSQLRMESLRARLYRKR